MHNPSVENLIVTMSSALSTHTGTRGLYDTKKGSDVGAVSVRHLVTSSLFLQRQLLRK